MNREEIHELLRLKGWTKTKLAVELGLGENIVHRWVLGDRRPGSPASILMRIWLEEAREHKRRQKMATERLKKLQPGS